MRLEIALKNLPDNPKPQCKGFYLAYYYKYGDTLTVEKIGDVPVEKQMKYFQFAVKKVMQTLSFGKIRSKEFENDTLEQYPGAITLINGCAGVSGHESMIDEAISTLWLIAIHNSGSMSNFNNWEVFLETARIIGESVAPDNKFIPIIAKLMTEQK